MAAQAPSILIYHPTPKAKKGEKLPVGTVKHDPYFTFRGGNQNIALDKADALFCKRYLVNTEGLDPEEAAQELAKAEQKIADALKRPVTDRWIAEEAADLKLTLVEVITTAVNYKKEVTRVITTAEGPERLSSFVTKLDPEKGPDELKQHLLEWIESDLDDSIEHIKKCLKLYGRSPKTNYIRLRAAEAEGKAA